MLRALFHWFVRITGFLPYLFCYRTKVYYEDKKAQSRAIKGKAIVCSNHRSVMDVALMFFLFPFRTLRPLVAELIFKKNPIFTLFLKMLGAIKVDRDSHDFSFLEKSRKILDKGGVIEVYPEARLPKKGEQTPLPFTPSTAYLALLSGAPVIPVYTNGCYFQKRRARVIIGKPIYPQELYDSALSDEENIEKITTILREKVIELQYELETKINDQDKKKA